MPAAFKRVTGLNHALVIFFLAVFLASCATAKINLQQSSSTLGLTMELKKKSFIIWAVDASKDGRYVLEGTPMAGCTIPIRLWDVVNGKQMWASTEFGCANSQNSLSFSPDEKSFIAGGSTGKLSLMDRDTGKEIRNLRGFSMMYSSSLAFSPDGRYFLAGGVNGNLDLWDAVSGKVIRRLSGHSGFGRFGVVWSVAFSPDGKYGLSGGADGTVRLWDIATGKNLRTFEHSSRVMSAKFMPGSRNVIAGDNEGNIKLWDSTSGKNILSLKEKEGVTSIAVSPDGQYLFAAFQQDMFSGELTAPISAVADSMQDKQVSKWNLATGERMNVYTFQIPKSIKSMMKIALSPDGKRLFVGGDSCLRILAVPEWKEIAMATGFDDNEWIVITSEGYYNASEKGAEYLRVLAGEHSYDVDSFYDVFYRPDIVAAKLRGEDISGLVKLTMKDAIQSPPPTVEFTTVPSDTDTARVKVCYQAKSSGGGIGEVRLFHNGKLIESDGYYREAARATVERTQVAALNSKAIYEDMRSVTIKEKAGISPPAAKAKGDVVDACSEIDAVAGENDIGVTAFNRENTVQGQMKTAKFNSKVPAQEPHLYILAIGIDQYQDAGVALKYTVKDARDIEAKLRQQTASLYDSRNIHYSLLANEQATKAAILGRISELAKTVRPTDSFILFVAGHGVLLQDQYYMLTHDYNGRASDASMISSNEIVEMSKKIGSLSQLFIFDTCHAGGMDAIVSGLYDARMSVLAKKMGLHIYASASSVQEALDGYEGNGLFSHTLIEGLNNNKQADRNDDGKVSLVELGEYARTRTTDISKGLGHAQTPFIINFGKDNPLYTLK
jgi:WD40 repeat protein